MLGCRKVSYAYRVTIAIVQSVYVVQHSAALVVARSHIEEVLAYVGKCPAERDLERAYEVTKAMK